MDDGRYGWRIARVCESFSIWDAQHTKIYRLEKSTGHRHVRLFQPCTDNIMQGSVVFAACNHGSYLIRCREVRTRSVFGYEDGGVDNDKLRVSHLE